MIFGETKAKVKSDIIKGLSIVWIAVMIGYILANL